MTRADGARGWAAVLLATYAAFVATVAIVPRPIDEGVTPWVRGVLAWLRGHGMPAWVDLDFVEAASHAVILIPFGILAVVAMGRRYAWAAVIAGVVLGVAVELAQVRFLGESSLEPPDIILNVTGAFIGVIAGYVILAGLDRGGRRGP